MLRLKPFLLNPVFSRIHNNVYKLYSKAPKKPEAALSLTNALGAQTKGAPATTIVSSPSESTSIVQASAEIQESAESGSVRVKKAGKCNTKVAPKLKKGKKCGQPKPVQPQDPGSPGGYYIQDKCDMYDIPKTNVKKWKAISYALVPLALGLSAFVLATREEGPEPEYIPYEYMYRRTKRFPWRDGKTSLFHGPNNLMPEEEEERLDREAKENPAENNNVRYKKHVNEKEEKIKRRQQHAQEEIERRKKRHAEERARQQGS